MERIIAYLIFVIGIYSAIGIGILKIGIRLKKVQNLAKLIGEIPTRISHIIVGILLIYLSIKSL
ncbi:hypothetical protein RJG79_04585 [Mycoplasmatota bacterium WC44]